jgi:NADH-quinone oxidoreductase subunit H
MALAWEFILPMAILNMLVAGVWRFMPAGVVRWLVCAIIIAVPCALLARGLKKRKKFEIRTYQFAE